MEFSTRSIHVGQRSEPVTGATIPPIFLSTTFTQSAPGEHQGYEYSRSGNPTRDALEECLASLEEGEACAAFSSGLAASAAVLQSLHPGDGVVGGHDLYGGSYRLLEQVFRPWGLHVAYAAGTSPEAYAKALASLARPRLVWVETPTNPLLDIVDIQRVAAIAHALGCLVVVDNTFATPYLQQPLKLGADLVVHSTTKYLGGHSDVVGGAVVAREAKHLEKVRYLQNATGAVPGPMDCYLIQRGLKTLGIRMQKHCANAQAIAEELLTWKQIREVIYPGSAGHQGHAAARRQMRAFGGMVTVRLHGGELAAKRFCSRLRLIACAESLGGVESLCSHPATMTHASIPPDVRESHGITGDLIRLSVGIEDIQDIQADLDQALRASQE
jgi:cystathionine beta-lyase/cystathionine gamma-synthase